MSCFRGILFDLDGTIADSIDFFCGLSREILTLAGMETLPERSALCAAIAQGIPPATRFLPADYPGREFFLERIYRDGWTTWIERYGAETRPLPGACESIASLHERGFRMGLVTSSSGELPFLDRWNIRRFFATVVCRDHVSQIKPHPEGLLASLERLDLPPGEVLHVGDTPIDVRAGEAAGLRTVGVLSGAGTEEQLRCAGAIAILASVAELPAYLDSGGAGE
jgi:phosphoglycolate phosphatase